MTGSRPDRAGGAEARWLSGLTGGPGGAGAVKCALMALVFLAALCPVALALEAERRVLDNGLTVLHAQRENLPLVMVTLLVKAGSVDEPARKAGLANLCAALLTEGTRSRPSTRISEEVEFIGAELGLSAMADYTTLSLSVLKRHLPKGFELLADVLLNPTFPPEEIKRKKALIKASLRQREESPAFLARRAFIGEVYGRHPYGRHVEGFPDTIDSITREDIAGFYKSRFLPNNSILSVAGDISRKELEGLIDTYLEGWRKRPIPRRVAAPLPPTSRKTLTIERDLTQANMLLGHPGIRRDDPDYYAVSVMNYILGGGGFSSRLMDSIRERMGLAYSVYSSASSQMEAGDFSVTVQTKNASARTVISEVLREMRALREKKVAKTELEDAKAFLIGSFPMRLETMRRIADFLCLAEFYGLGLDYPEKYRRHISAVTREDVLRAAGEYLNPDNYVLVVVGKGSETKVKGR